MTSLPPPPVTWEVREEVGYLALAAPPRNEMDDAFIGRLLTVLEVARSSAGLRGLILHGSGRHFSSGANLPQLLERFRALPFAENLELSRRLTGALQTLHESPFPVVAAVSGCCFGSGLELALACQVRLAARNALFGAPETSLQVMPGCGATVRLPQLIGRGPALDLILGGHLLDAKEALRLGLVDALCERSDLLPAALKLIQRWR